jgi:hypothetical protein
VKRAFRAETGNDIFQATFQKTPVPKAVFCLYKSGDFGPLPSARR